MITATCFEAIPETSGRLCSTPSLTEEHLTYLSDASNRSWSFQVANGKIVDSRKGRSCVRRSYLTKSMVRMGLVIGRNNTPTPQSPLQQKVLGHREAVRSTNHQPGPGLVPERPDDLGLRSPVQSHLSSAPL